MDGKVFIKFNGGLGNQMFQWAFGRMLEETTDMEVHYDMSYFTKKYARPYQLNLFNANPRFIEDLGIKLKLALIWLLRRNVQFDSLFGITMYKESCFNFDNNIHKIKPNTYVEGFFQSELYFKCVEDKLREDFRFKKEPDAVNTKLIKQMGTTNSISLHIRRGDYVQKERYQQFYATCSLDYYKRGVEYIAQKDTSSQPVIFVFSDDIRWVKKNLDLPYEMIFVCNNTGEKSYEDMRLMSLCRHNIIANSSFSWWGAWLNKNPNKIVVAPQKWFNDDSIIQTDVIPQSWTRLANSE